MEVHCQHCQTKFNLPDEKVPENQVLKIGCPKCKGKITIDTRKKTGAPAKESPAAKEAGAAKNAQAAGTKEKYDYADYSDDDSIGFIEEGTKLALALDNPGDRLETVRSSVEGLGYKFVASPNTRDAIGKMRFHHFDLIIVADGFDGQPIEHSPIINSLNHMSMMVRRRIFLALLSDKFKTMDNMMAFSMSANLTINPNDMKMFTAILKKGISENQRFYKVFNETLEETGKV